MIYKYFVFRYHSGFIEYHRVLPNGTYDCWSEEVAKWVIGANKTWAIKIQRQGEDCIIEEVPRLHVVVVLGRQAIEQGPANGWTNT